MLAALRFRLQSRLQAGQKKLNLAVRPRQTGKCGRYVQPPAVQTARPNTLKTFHMAAALDCTPGSCHNKLFPLPAVSLRLTIPLLYRVPRPALCQRFGRFFCACSCASRCPDFSPIISHVTARALFCLYPDNYAERDTVAVFVLLAFILYCVAKHVLQCINCSHEAVSLILFSQHSLYFSILHLFTPLTTPKRTYYFIATFTTLCMQTFNQRKRHEKNRPAG